jgi:RimJ/RimL family protein N-acetyltransferase
LKRKNAAPGPDDDTVIDPESFVRVSVSFWAGSARLLPRMDTSPAIVVPRLQTRRLLLREYRVGDFEAFAAHLADPESMTFLDLEDRRTAWRIFACHAGLWLLDGAGWWSAELRDTGHVVGHVGAFFREGWPGMEIGWNTYRAFWGRGFASEAAAEVVRHAFEVRKEPQIRALIDPGNGPSLGVAQRLGMHQEAETQLFGKPIGLHTLQR